MLEFSSIVTFEQVFAYCQNHGLEEPSQAWAYRFVLREERLKRCRAHIIDEKRAAAMTMEIMAPYFDHLSTLMAWYRPHPSLVLNCDETFLLGSNRKGKVIGHANKKKVFGQQKKGARGHITLNVCIALDGSHAPVAAIITNKNLPQELVRKPAWLVSTPLELRSLQLWQRDLSNGHSNGLGLSHSTHVWCFLIAAMWKESGRRSCRKHTSNAWQHLLVSMSPLSRRRRRQQPPQWRHPRHTHAVHQYCKACSTLHKGSRKRARRKP